MKLRAKVTTVIGKSTNYLGTIVEGVPVPIEQLPDPTWLEISQEGHDFFLLYLNADGECIADTWHQTLESAQKEGMLAFGIKPNEWTVTG